MRARLFQGPPPAGLVRCAECRLCYPSVQLLAAHQVTAHAQTAEQDTESVIQVRNDYLKTRRTDPSTLVEMATVAAAAAASLSKSARLASTLPLSAASDEPAAVSEADMEARLAALADLERIRCKQCGSEYKSAHNLRRHIAGHIGWTRHGCPQCGHRYYERCDVIKHMRRMHKVPVARAEEELLRWERQQTGNKSTRRRRSSAAVAEAKAAAAAALKVTDALAEPPPSLLDLLDEPPQKAYEMRDLTVPRSSPPVPSSTRLFSPLLPKPGVSPVPPSPPLLLPLPSHFAPSRYHPVPPLLPQAPRVAPPPVLTRRRPGRKNLTGIIHYINSSAEPSTPDLVSAGSSWPEGSNIFQQVPTTSGLTAICERPKPGEPMEDEVCEADDAAADDGVVDAGLADEDDDLEEFMSLSSGAELEPGAVWRTLPPLVPLLGVSPRAHCGTEASSPGTLRQRAGFQRLSDGAQQHDCNENIEHRPVRDDRTPPVDIKSFSMSPNGKTASPYLQKYPSDELNFFPRVLLTDIALRRCNSSPTPARPASPGGSAVYPAGARLGLTGPVGEADSPPTRKGSPSGAASASGGTSPSVERQRRGRPPRSPKTLKKGGSDTDLRLVAIGASEAEVAATAAGEGTTGAVGAAKRSPRSPRGRLKVSAKLFRRGPRSVSAPGRVGPTKRAFIPAGGSSERSPGASPPVRGRGRGRKVNPGATAGAESAAAARQGRSPPAAGRVDGAARAAFLAPVPYVPSVWPPMVRKRSWSSPDDEFEQLPQPDAIISAAENVKRRRYRNLSDRAGVR